MGTKNNMFGVKLSNITKQKSRQIALGRVKFPKAGTLVIVTDTINNNTVQYRFLREAATNLNYSFSFLQSYSKKYTLNTNKYILFNNRYSILFIEP